jgi:uncharacterized protein
MSKATNILFIHGAGEGSYEWSVPMVDTIQKSLGGDHKIHFSKMPEEGDYDDWAKSIKAALSTLKGRVILIGHSFGGSALLRYLAENTVEQPIEALFLLAVPYWGEGGWDSSDFKIPDNFESKLKPVPHIFIYHNEDDEEVPFAHHKLYLQKIPAAVVHIGKSGGHAMKTSLADVAKRIKTL